MKNILILLISLFLLTNCNFRNEEKKNTITTKEYKDELIIYSVDDFLEHNSFINKIKSKFEMENNCKVKIISYKSEKKLIKDLNKKNCDLALNIDYLNIAEISVDSSYTSVKIKEFPEKLPIKNILIPYSYNFMSFSYNSQILKNPPNSFGTIQDGLLRNSFSFPNPLNSRFGHRTIVWTINNFKLGFIHVWRSLKRNLLGFSENLEESVLALITEEASIAPTPLTVADYLWKKKKIDYIKSFIPLEGTYKYYQCSLIPKNSKNIMHAKLFIHFLLSKNIQNRIYPEAFNFPIKKDLQELKTSQKIVKPDCDFENKINYLTFNKNYNKYWKRLWKRKMKELL